MQVVRIYTGEDGESHFEELELPFEAMARCGAHGRPERLQRHLQPHPAGQLHRLAPGARRQYVITLEGQTEIGLGDGTKRIFSAGDILLADDLTGRGHTTAVYGDIPRVSVAIPIVD